MTDLTPLSDRCRRDPFFLGYSLAQTGLSDEDLAERLGCGVDRLPALFLCRAVDPDDVEAVPQIAEHVGCDAEALADLLEMDVKTEPN